MFAYMRRAGALPPIPEALSGQDIDIEYKGPLARSQKTARLAAFDEVFQKIQLIAQIDPQAAIKALDNFDLDALIRDQASVAGLRSEDLTSIDYRKKVRDARNEQQQQAAKLNAGTQLAEAAGKVLPHLPALRDAMGGANGAPTGKAA